MENALKGNFLSYYWHGQGPLWKIYWLYGVFGSLILAGLLMLPIEQTGHIRLGHYLLAVGVLCLYSLWINVSVWRCANNVQRKEWGYAARALTVFWAINVILLLLFVGLDRVQL